jgi:hypothetical protein
MNKKYIPIITPKTPPYVLDLQNTLDSKMELNRKN